VLPRWPSIKSEVRNDGLGGFWLLSPFLLPRFTKYVLGLSKEQDDTFRKRFFSPLYWTVMGFAALLFMVIVAGETITSDASGDEDYRFLEECGSRRNC